VANFFPAIHSSPGSVARPQLKVLQFRDWLEPTPCEGTSAAVQQMKTAQDELPRIGNKPQKPAPTFIDVNADCQSIVVSASAAEVYRRCLRFEDLPQFITSIRRVERIDETRFSCTSIINGEEVTSVIKIIMRVPDRRIAWQAVSDHFRVGVVFLDTLDDGTTKVTVKVRSIIEPVLLTGALRSYLSNFQRFVEEKATR
jgi:uncharacterized membrane protein